MLILNRSTNGYEDTGGGRGRGKGLGGDGLRRRRRIKNKTGNTRKRRQVERMWWKRRKGENR